MTILQGTVLSRHGRNEVETDNRPIFDSQLTAVGTLSAICDYQIYLEWFRSYLSGSAGEAQLVATLAATCCNESLQTVLNAAVQKFDRGLSQLLQTELNWLYVPERVRYKLAVTVHQCLSLPYNVLCSSLFSGYQAASHGLPRVISWWYRRTASVCMVVGLLQLTWNCLPPHDHRTL